MGRSSFKKRLAVAVTVALSLMFVLSIIPFPLIEAHVLAASNTDIINVPFANGPNGATTANTYTGNVTITVSGHGHASQSAESDAFYIYTDNSGNPITPEHHFDFGLCINQKPVENYVAVSPYRDDHTYQFTISAGDSPQKLTFGVCDTYTVDNTGAFTITVKGKDDSTPTPPVPEPVGTPPPPTTTMPAAINIDGTAWCEPLPLMLIASSNCDLVEIRTGGRSFETHPNKANLTTPGGGDFRFTNLPVDAQSLSDVLVIAYRFQKDSALVPGNYFYCTETVTLTHVSDNNYEIRFKDAENHAHHLGPWPQRQPCRPSNSGNAR